MSSFTTITVANKGAERVAQNDFFQNIYKNIFKKGDFSTAAFSQTTNKDGSKTNEVVLGKGDEFADNTSTLEQPKNFQVVVNRNTEDLDDSSNQRTGFEIVINRDLEGDPNSNSVSQDTSNNRTIEINFNPQDTESTSSGNSGTTSVRGFEINISSLVNSAQKFGNNVANLNNSLFQIELASA
ncbi:MAG: hypothetical protein QNJ31_02305 [Candidatus Caenarcaniphilales bacterium]|nr:hypothetical protein [Candidatus Caenarcaniphilales bacterium]